MNRVNERLLLFVFTLSMAAIGAAVFAVELHRLLGGLGGMFQ